ncbi:MAG: CheF family chemotaxis protein [Halobacteriaceae archaeon]
MSKVVADFHPELYAETPPCEEPTKGRIVMSPGEVVAVFPEETLRIDQSNIFDVVIREPQLDIEFIDTVVTIAYRRLNETQTLFIGTDPDTIEQFRQVLFKSLLTGTSVYAHHPARVGGRVTGTDAHEATLGIKTGELLLRSSTTTESLALADVTDFGRQQRALGTDSSAMSAVKIREFVDGESQTSFVGSRDERILNLLGRYLRIEYATLREEIQDLDLTSDDVELLVTLYSVDSAADLSRTLGLESSVLKTKLKKLHDAELLVKSDNGAGYDLTDKGRIIVNQRLESVNA